MKLQYASELYESEFREDNKDGCAGFDLYRTTGDKKTRVASVIYWDAIGTYYIDTSGNELPLPIIEALIAETKAAVNVPTTTFR